MGAVRYLAPDPDAYVASAQRHAPEIEAKKRGIAALSDRVQASDIATGAGITGSSGGGRIATMGAIVGLRLGRARFDALRS